MKTYEKLLIDVKDQIENFFIPEDPSISQEIKNYQRQGIDNDMLNKAVRDVTVDTRFTSIQSILWFKPTADERLEAFKDYFKQFDRFEDVIYEALIYKHDEGLTDEEYIEIWFRLLEILRSS